MLTDDCGHHCGTDERGEHHCPCPECHRVPSFNDVVACVLCGGWVMAGLLVLHLAVAHG